MDNKQREILFKALISEDVNEVEQLYRTKRPKSLIKFYSGFSDNDGAQYPQIDALTNNSIWLSSPRVFNDPFDCMHNVDYTKQIAQDAIAACTQLFGEDIVAPVFAFEDNEQKLYTYAKNFTGDFQKDINTTYNRYFIGCFSESFNINSLRMWGHYANSHRGFIVEYDLGKIDQISGCALFPVFYSKTYQSPQIPWSRSQFSKYALDTVFRKAIEWRYEREWRWMEYSEEHTGQSGILKPFVEPSRIFMGCRVGEEVRKRLFLLCAKKKIPLYQMTIKLESYGLICEKVVV